MDRFVGWDGCDHFFDPGAPRPNDGARALVDTADLSITEGSVTYFHERQTRNFDGRRIPGRKRGAAAFHHWVRLISGCSVESWRICCTAISSGLH